MVGETLPKDSGLSKVPKTIIIGTAGHIDHGKTTLIRALTGVDTDRLPEEKKRGITVDLGFGSLELTAPDGSPLRVSFIDVPGHARFVRNMLAGAGGIDAVLLVISAEEGVKPQTEEHLAICSLLGIKRGITVLTKIDAIGESRLREIRSSVERFLSPTFLSSEPCVATSAFTGDGLGALRRELSLLPERVPARNTEFQTRLPIDRAFAMKGFGTVVTGTLISGAVEAGQELVVEPGGRTAKVRGIQVHGRPAMRAEAAMRVALNLSRIETAELQRGDTLVAPSTIAAVDTIDVEINLLTDAPVLKHRARVHFHAFASESMATISLYGYQAIEPNTQRLVRLRLVRPIALLPGDRFVLRQGSPITTVGGGVVLDAQPVPRRKKARVQQWLQQLLHATPEEQLALRVARRDVSGIYVTELSTETGWKADAIQDRLGPALLSGQIRSLENALYLTREAMFEASALVEQNLKRMFEATGTDRIKRSALRSQTRVRPEVLDCVEGLLKESKRFRIAGDELFCLGNNHDAPFPDEDRLSAIERAYRQAGLAPPSPANLGAELAIDPGGMRQLITILLRESKLVRLGDDSLCVHQDALIDLKGRVKELHGQTIDVAQFKLLAGVSRKYAIPLLEYLDRERVTRKQDDHRVVL